MWSITHLITIIPTFIIFIVAAIFIAKYLKNENEKTRYLPFQIMSIIILLLELFKQINSIDSYKNGELYSLPFHYFSLFLYLLPLHSFYKGKYKKSVDAITLACCASLFMDMLIMPGIIYGEGNIKDIFGGFGNFHTVIFHNLVSFYFVLMVAMRMFEFNPKKDIKVIGIFLAIYVIIAATLSQLLKTNFHNLYRCNLDFIEQIRLSVVDSFGFFGQMIYIFALFVLTILFAYLAYFATKGVMSLVDKFFNKEGEIVESKED